MAWYDEAIFYHIYPLGLCGSEKVNAFKGEGRAFSEMNLWPRHIQEIGCNAVYIGPLFESSTHGYDTADYQKVDGRLGSNADFKHWVQLCHEAGIRVVVDGVFNHTGRDFFAFKDLLERRRDSWGKAWYCNVNFDQHSPIGDAFNYESWRGYAQLPKLDLKNPAVCDYLLERVRYWVDHFDIDGIRLDCADVLDFDFMKQLRRMTSDLKVDFWLMGEVIHGDYGRWVNDEALHSVTNYELHKGIYSAHNTHNYFEMAHTIRRLFAEDHGICKGKRLYNFVDNHDVDRIYDKLDNKAHLMPVYAFLYTIWGIPSIYYGSEWGISGRKAGGSDDPLRPEIALETFINPHPELTAYITDLAAIHRQCPELTYGIYKELLLTNRQYAFARIGDGYTCITILNNDDDGCQVQVKLPSSASCCRDLMNHEVITVILQNISVYVDGNAARILRVEA